MQELCLITNPVEAIVCPQGPLWGKFRIRNTHCEALKSIPQNVIDERFIRLVLVVSTRQLKCMLDPGREACRSEATPYLEVVDTCPLYYLAWAAKRARGTMQIKSNIPHNGPRDFLIAAATGRENGKKHAVIASVPGS